MSLSAIRNRAPLRPPPVTVEESDESAMDGWDLFMDTDDWCPVCDLMWCREPACTMKTAEILERYR